MEPLLFAYIFAALAALIKMVRYMLEYSRARHGFILLGILANISLVIALSTLAVSIGVNPGFSRQTLITLIRASVFSWAIFSIVYELMYSYTWINLIWKKKVN